MMENRSGMEDGRPRPSGMSLDIRPNCLTSMGWRLCLWIHPEPHWEILTEVFQGAPASNSASCYWPRRKSAGVSLALEGNWRHPCV